MNRKKLMRMQMIRGMLLRIILACLIFILLFVGKKFSIELFNHTTDDAIEMVQDNSWVESIQKSVSGWFQ